MKSKSIVIVTVLFAILLIGIIAIQAWWIYRALQLNTEQFDAATYRSLENVVKQTEQKENFTFMKKALGFDSIVNMDRLQDGKKMKVHHGHSAINNFVNNKIDKLMHTYNLSYLSVVSNNQKTVVNIGSNKIKNNAISGNFVFNENMSSADSEIEHTSKKTGKLEPAIKTGSRLSFLNETMDRTDSEIEKANKKIANIDTMLQKMIHIKNSDSLSAKPTDIQKLIKGQLAQNDLPDTFNFALLKSNGKYAYKSPGFYDTVGCYKIHLYPNDLFGRNILLFINIPGKLMRVHSDIWWAFILSLLFTISLLILFIYSIKMLITHKNLLATKNDFINHVSHEIKTPLAGISLGADMLMEKNDRMTSEQIGKVAHSIKEQSSRLHNDMSAVLLNALADEAPTIKLTPFNIINTVKNSINEFNLVFADKNAKIETHFGQEIIMVNGNELLWQKVFCNLLDNSIKFSIGVPVINIRGSLGYSTTLLLQFSDKGIGIRKEDLSRIFEKFYRSEYYKQSTIQGFGLGLSFVKKVVEMHNGKVKAESNPGNGTTITIELPISND